MSSNIKDPRNFCVGAMFSTVGVAAVLIGRSYAMGSAGRMGPAYFPTVLGVLLAIIGVVAIIRSLLKPGEAMEKFAFRELALILGSVVAFGLVLRGAGLAPAVLLLVLGSGLASKQFHLGRFLAVGLGLSVFATLVFIKGLGLPLTIIGPWFGG